MAKKDKKVGIIQSCYIPWKGYFDFINYVDEFVIFDDVQYTKRDWRNRNYVYLNGKKKILSIPVKTKGKFEQKINETNVLDHKWRQSHWSVLFDSYRHTEFFKKYEHLIKDVYLSKLHEYEHDLTSINAKFIHKICEILGIDTPIRFSHEFELKDGKTDRLLGICKDLGADTYVSGPAAKDYLDEKKFNKEGLKVEWFDYSGYKPYTQASPEFDHGVSILDLLFNEGPNSLNFMKTLA